MADRNHPAGRTVEAVQAPASATAKVAVLVSGAVAIAALAGFIPNIKTATGTPAQPVTVNYTVPQKTRGIADLIEAVKPAVVNISVSGKTGGQQAFNGGPQFGPGHNFPFDEFFRHRFGGRGGSQNMPKPDFKAVGSGFIISEDGLVVTNSHVVKNADKVTVTLDDGKQYSAKLRGIDSKTDLALLEIDSSDDFTFVQFGQSDSARVGDQILAIGNPFGLGNTATTGIISARGRDIHSGPFDDFIQIDAPINQGNSGGPLFDMNGRVIGINTAIYSPNGGNVGIGFAIPASQANAVIDQLRSNGRVERGWLGVRIQPLTEELASSLSLDESGGALVVEVTPGSPAERGGLKVGDVIRQFGNQPVQSPKDLSRIVANASPSEKHPVSVWRDGNSRRLTVVTGEMPDAETVASGNSSDSATGKAKIGLALAPLNSATRQQYRVSGEVRNGAVIVNVESGSPAAMTGLQPGDVIVRIGNRRVSTPNEVVEAVKQKSDADQKHVMMLISRGETSRFVTVNLA